MTFQSLVLRSPRLCRGLLMAVLLAVVPVVFEAGQKGELRTQRLEPLLLDERGQNITTKEEWARHREVLRKKWLVFLGGFPREKVALRPRVLGTERLPDFTRQYVRYQVERGVFTDGYLLTPRGARGKLPAIVAFHQTCLTQAKQPAGVDATDSTMMYGVHLVRRGYVVWAPRCFIFQPNGGRSTGQKPTKTAAFTEATRKVLVTHPAWKGMTRMACDASRVVDYLETLPMVDGNRIGCIGHSLGAKEVLYAAAFDERIKAAVFSEGGIGLTSSNWAAIWYLGPDIRRPDFSLEHHQLLSLIAPRGFLLLAGGHADGDGSWPFIEAVLPVYKLLGGPENIKWFNHHQGHTYPAEARAVAEAFLDQYLKQ